MSAMAPSCAWRPTTTTISTDNNKPSTDLVPASTRFPPSVTSERRSRKPSQSAVLCAPCTVTVSFVPSTEGGEGETIRRCPTAEARRAALFPNHTSQLQYSIHKPGRHLRRELALVLPDALDKSAGGGTPFPTAAQLRPDLLVIPLFQQSAHELVAVTPETNWERDLLLDYVHSLATRIVAILSARGYWADLTDPASGYPSFSSRGTSLYPDVDGAASLLRYATVQAGCCRVLVHPKWGTRSYPSTMFCAAPVEVVSEVVRDVCGRKVPLVQVR
ncbi:uncharacterized protein EV422DRAFT_530854 [Fimicolochytrium jonesii]|uniref:uncharacterized protein n=1 Tax=Fimicolochytrium jonesii TaxID=1396493 RepID=UPI0022FE0D20|nr:uncharacterized protein EV422DRAFT_530854 [Fimicolochytrium jonesii]KAI8820428.1 hypothetical protein EV422DRAFT_530854 [Fimicolochytrium jonesii]